MIIGLTGPIGAGKDEVAKVLAKSGAFVIDADQVAHSLYPQVAGQLVKEFGTVERSKLAEIVFADKNKLLKLNQIIHPALYREIKKIVESKKLNVERRIVINAAVLKEIGLIELVDQVWVVLASKENRLARSIKSGLAKSAAEQRMAAQMSEEEYRALADVVIENNGTLEQLEKEVIRLI
ncbi:MAG: dephospho-CoA kinase [bacterium]